MMFLIRTAFWLLVIVLLLPTDQEQQDRIYGTAQAAVNDVAGFCDRNPQTCASGQEAFAVLVQKAQYGAQIVMAFVEGKDVPFDGGARQAAAMPAAEPAPQGGIMDDGSVMPVPAAAPLEPLEPVASDTAPGWDGGASQDTLNAGDREARWTGPNV